MIGPTTRLLGLVTADAEDGWLARLYNYLLGFNGHDAAYVLFVVRPDALDAVLSGFVRAGKFAQLHVAPSHWAAAARWAGASLPLVDVLRLTPQGVVADFEHARRVAAFAGPGAHRVLGEGALAAAVRAALETATGVTRAALPAPGDVAPGPGAATAARQADAGTSGLVLDAALPGEPGALAPLPGAPREVWSASSWSLEPPRRRALPEAVRLGPPFTLWVQRAGDELQAAFGAEPRVPDDLTDALAEPTFRPCKLTHDDFRERHGHARTH